MAKLDAPITVTITGIEFVRQGIKKFVDEFEFSENTSEDFKAGFYAFGNSVLDVLDKMEEEK